MNQQNQSLPHGVIFDVDGVLVDSEHLINHCSCQMFAELGITASPADFAQFVGTGEGQFILGVAQMYNRTIDLPAAKKRIYQLYLEHIKGRLKPIPGVLEFIQKCKTQNKKIALATSADYCKLNGNLIEINLPAATFDAVVTGENVTHKKPAPDLFLLAAQKLNLPPQHCLVIEDAVVGITAAHAAGCQCLAITSSFTPQQLKNADYIAPNFNQIPHQTLIWDK
ncbi:MAG: HAD-IA family hydrolase [Planctomycetes bacterium]|nr:HAD-IA family hydrolase [Planctomycetota bacterium]